ncbi:MAG TPA: hypothetical protein VNL91_11340, partial [Thermoanaerobaculia bacterium]|nr:hypothetical protein [Thermoanaerobaculia bacterium]
STATGFHASQGGTVNVTGTNNVINTTAGNAFEAIGTSGEHMGGGYAFRSISSANGTRGISVQYHDGAFSVSGDGPDAGTSPDSAIAGGTISGSDVRGAEFIDVDGPISLGGMTFTNPADTAGPDTTLATGTCGSVVSGNNSGCYAGIHIDTAANVTIDTVNVSGSGQMGINGRAINNLTLSTVNVSNSGTSAQEDGIRLFNTTGSGSMTNVSVTNSYSIGLHMANASGTLASSASPFTITNGTFQGSTDAQGALVNAASSGTMYVKFLNGTVSNNFSNGIHSVINTGSTGTLEVTIDGVSLSNNAAAVVMHGQAGALNFDVRNTIHTARSTNSGHSYVIKGDNTGTLNGSLTGNTIGNGTAGSGASCGGACNGINVDARNTSTITVAIRGNTIQNVDFNGIDVFAGQGSARTHATITGNLIRNPDGAFSFAGVFAESGISTSDSSCVTAQIGGLTAWPGAPSTTAAEIQNRIEGAWGTSGIRVRKVGDATAPDPVFNLPLYDGSGVNTWIQNRNSFSGVASPVTNSVGGPAIGGGTSCP